MNESHANTAAAAGHTPGPWHIFEAEGGNLILNAPHTGGRYTGAVVLNADSNHNANAARIVACVNACEGIADPVDALASVRQLLAGWLRDIESPEDQKQVREVLRKLG